MLNRDAMRSMMNTGEDAKHIIYPTGKGMFLRKNDEEAVRQDKHLRKKSTEITLF